MNNAVSVQLTGEEQKLFETWEPFRRLLRERRQKMGGLWPEEVAARSEGRIDAAFLEALETGINPKTGELVIPTFVQVDRVLRVYNSLLGEFFEVMGFSREKIHEALDEIDAQQLFDDSEPLRRFVRGLRAKEGSSLEDVAARGKISKDLLLAFESGFKPDGKFFDPTPEEMYAVANVYRRPAEEFFRLQGLSKDEARSFSRTFETASFGKIEDVLSHVSEIYEELAKSKNDSPATIRACQRLSMRYNLVLCGLGEWMDLFDAEQVSTEEIAKPIVTEEIAKQIASEISFEIKFEEKCLAAACAIRSI